MTTAPPAPLNDLEQSGALLDATGAPALTGSRCRTCGRVDFPARTICHRCAGQDLVRERVGSTGRLHS